MPSRACRNPSPALNTLLRRPPQPFLVFFCSQLLPKIFTSTFKVEAIPPMYRYKPIEHPDQIRMLRILPGEDNTPVKVEITHHPLSDMSHCEALSYEWGAAAREMDIACDGFIIKGTPNLLVALKRLRQRSMERELSASTSMSTAIPSKAEDCARTKQQELGYRIDKSSLSGSGLLWIDAICINQENDYDKSQQLPLMGRIYGDTLRVLIWIGEEPTHPEYALRCIGLLDTAARDQKDFAEHIFAVEESLTLEDEVSIGQLANDAAWPSVVDVLCSRSYFTRLWTMQEIVLSNPKSAQVLWGRCLYSWLGYCNAIRMVMTSHVLSETVSVNDYTSMARISRLCFIQEYQSRSLPLTLTSIYEFTAEQRRHVSVSHDRVYALLGMLNSRTQKLLGPLSYTRPIGELFQMATLIMVLESQDLCYMLENNVCVNLPDAASWTGFSSLHPHTTCLSSLQDVDFFPRSPITFELGDMVITAESLYDENPIPARIDSSPTLVTKGFVLDTITASFENFSLGNAEKQLISAYHKAHDYYHERKLDVENLIDAVWEPLQYLRKYGSQEDRQKYGHQKLAFTVSLSNWIMEEIERGKSEPKENTTGIESTPPFVAHNANEHGPSFSQEEIQFFTKHAKLGKLMSAEKLIERHLYKENGRVTKYYGRNLFFTSKGYSGIGPMGDNREGELPAVQVGDKLMVLDCFEGQIYIFVLRPQSDGLYTFVGQANVPGAVEYSMFKAGNVPDFIEIRIR